MSSRRSARMFLGFRSFWLLVALGLFLVWLHIHDMPYHQHRTSAVAVAFVVSLLLVWRPDGRFTARRVKRR